MNEHASTAAATAKGMHGSVALIAGSCDKTGAAIACSLAAKGAVVALCGAGRDALESLVGTVAAQGGQAIALAAEPAAISAVVGDALAKFGKIDILVNNPGDIVGRPLLQQSTAEFESDVTAILTTSFRLLREVVPAMCKARHGRIVNVFDMSYLGLPGRANLAAASAGVFGLTRSAALELAAAGITVNSVVKGDVAGSDLPAADAEKLAGQIPVKRIGAPADIAHAVAFFAAPSAKYVTGQTLFVCGGKSAHFSMSV